MEEPWMEETRQQMRWDSRMKNRPVCMVCREPIGEERCLPVGSGNYICPGCIRLEMVETESVA